MRDLTGKTGTADKLVSLNDMLDREGIREEATLRAFKRIVAIKLEREMVEQGVSKADLARRMGTSRAQLDRVLDPEASNVTLDSVARAARSLGKSFRFELV